MCDIGAMSQQLDWIDEELAELDRRGLRRRLRVAARRDRGNAVIDGREVVNFASNDYLGLASHTRLVQTAAEALKGHGWGSGASPQLGGRSPLHAELEDRLARFEDVEAALLFPSGFAANAGIIPALAGGGDAIFSDAKNHASIVDGCRLSRAARFIYDPADCASLEALLSDASRFRRRLIVTDSLFSIEGDLAPLVEIGHLAARFDAMLLVDEAHATGVFGVHGRGVVEALSRVAPELDHQVTIRVGTLSKSIGSAGGFVCGDARIIDWLANRARSYFFSTSPPAAVCSAALAGLSIIGDEPQRRRQLLAEAAKLRRRLQAQGWDTGPSESQIIPIRIGSNAGAMELAAQLLEQGFYVPGIRPPTVPDGEALLRISVNYHHPTDAINRLCNTLDRLRASAHLPARVKVE